MIQKIVASRMKERSKKENYLANLSAQSLKQSPTYGES